jgi:hypothetical protein
MDYQIVNNHRLKSVVVDPKADRLLYSHRQACYRSDMQAPSAMS